MRATRRGSWGRVAAGTAAVVAMAALAVLADKGTGRVTPVTDSSGSVTVVRFGSNPEPDDVATGPLSLVNNTNQKMSLTAYHAYQMEISAPDHVAAGATSAVTVTANIEDAYYPGDDGADLTYSGGGFSIWIHLQGHNADYVKSTDFWGVNVSVNGNPCSACDLSDSDPSNQASDTTLTSGTPVIFMSSIVPSGTALAQSSSLPVAASPDGSTHLFFQDDGNLVLYENGSAIWASNTWGKSGFRAEMQADGNLVVYEYGSPWWASNTAGQDGDAGSYLKVEVGQMQIISPDSGVLATYGN